MNAGDLMTFRPGGRDRENLPVLVQEVIGRPIECADQKATFRCLPGDRVRVAEIRSDRHSVLVTHSAVQGGVLLVCWHQLEAIEQPDLNLP